MYWSTMHACREEGSETKRHHGTSIEIAELGQGLDDHKRMRRLHSRVERGEVNRAIGAEIGGS